MKLLVLLSTLVLSACETFPTMPTIPEQKPKPVACDNDASFEAGMNDGMAHVKMDSDFLSTCAKQNQASLRKSYKDGYLKGVNTKSTEKVYVPAAGGDTYGGNPGVNINIGNNGSSQAQAYTCEVSAFTKDYSSFGRTMQEAKFRVKQLCQAENDKMFCDDVKCTNNY
jgi:hypothetical protein